ncbi:MAG: YggS family pyridoxal phosphate-dependent enzyme [Flavipsychrobacter sp.]|nr:YggS family pyridoxal phosphate-dependent enzyme [Flavipsychrobacter sp.]
MVHSDVWKDLTVELSAKRVQLVAVSKTKPVADIEALYELGQRDFAENYVQELLDKQQVLPNDIKWHFTGHLQSNKVKQIAPFVHLVHAVDSFKLLQEIDKQGRNNNRTIDVLLQLHIADEATKFGMDEKEIIETLDRVAANEAMQNVRICGLMGMATNSDNEHKVRSEFARLYSVFKNLSQSYFIKKEYFSIISMGMSGDYKLAVEEGSTMVRIGSLLFGER